MIINEKINIKLYYRFVKYVSKMLKNELPHERYKLITFDEYNAQTKVEKRVKRLAEAYLYLMNNVNQTLDEKIIETTYFILTHELLEKEITKKILKEYYKNYGETSHYLAVLIHLNVLENIKKQQYEFAFIMSNYIMLKKKRYPLIPYTYYVKEYFESIKEKDKNKLTKVFIDIESITFENKDKEEIKLEEVIERLSKEKEKLKREYQIKNMYIYGSYSKGTNTNYSDLDLLVIYENELEKEEKRKLRKKLINYLSPLLKIGVDIIEFDTAMEKMDIDEMEKTIEII